MKAYATLFLVPGKFQYQLTCDSQGLRLAYYDSKADILLLEVAATIPDAFKPYKLGYNGMETAIPKRAIGIHHPNGNFKRISYANHRCACRRHDQPSAPTCISDDQIIQLALGLM